MWIYENTQLKNLCHNKLDAKFELDAESDSNTRIWIQKFGFKILDLGSTNL